MKQGEKKPYWELRELVTIGIFAAIAKVSAILVTVVGGGMNPLTLILKNLVYTTLMVVMLYKVRKFGSLLLFLFIGTLVSMLLMGGGFFLIPPMVIASLAAEGVIVLLGGYRKSINLMIGVGTYDLLFKISSVGISWLYLREQPGMIVMTAMVVGIGYLGAFIGLFTGARFVKELRHASIIRD